MGIRSVDMRGARDRSLPPPEGLKPAAACGGSRQAERREPQGAAESRDYVRSPEETGRRSVGNRKECRLRHDYASFPGPSDSIPRFALTTRCFAGDQLRPGTIVSAMRFFF